MEEIIRIRKKMRTINLKFQGEKMIKTDLTKIELILRNILKIGKGMI